MNISSCRSAQDRLDDFQHNGKDKGMGKDNNNDNNT